MSNSQRKLFPDGYPHMSPPFLQTVSQDPNWKREYEKTKKKYKKKKKECKELKKSYNKVLKEKETLNNQLKEKNKENMILSIKVRHELKKIRSIEKKLEYDSIREMETDEELKQLKEMNESSQAVDDYEELPMESYVICGICKDEIVPGPSMLFAVSGCEHKMHYECIQDYVRKALNDRSIVPLKCVEESCTSTISADNLENYGLFGQSGEDYMKYMRWEIENLSRIIITCPNCEEKMENDQIELTNVVCPNCDGNFCAKCHVKWSEHRDPNTGVDYTCEEYQNRHEIAVRSLISESGWKYCPACNEAIEKMEGCYHMHCRCGTDFCYICGNSIDDIGKHYSDKHPMFTEQDILRE